MNDDLNTAVAIAHLFTLLKYINMVYMKQLAPAVLGEELFESLKSKYIHFFEDILGLKEEPIGDNESIIRGMLDYYKKHKAVKEYDKVDEIRAYFKENGMVIRDMKHGIDWAWEE